MKSLFKINFKCFSIRNRNITEIDLENIRINEFIDIFHENFPIKLNKKDLVMPDQNLTCFIPFMQILNKTKIVSISKTFIDNLMNDNDLSDICEENLTNRIYYNLDKTTKFNKNPHSILKYKMKLNTDLRKTSFH